jgi:hypothetical protein
VSNVARFGFPISSNISASERCLAPESLAERYQREYGNSGR